MEKGTNASRIFLSGGRFSVKKPHLYTNFPLYYTQGGGRWMNIAQKRSHIHTIYTGFKLKTQINIWYEIRIFFFVNPVLIRANAYDFPPYMYVLVHCTQKNIHLQIKNGNFYVIRSFWDLSSLNLYWLILRPVQCSPTFISTFPCNPNILFPWTSSSIIKHEVYQNLSPFP